MTIMFTFATICISSPTTMICHHCTLPDSQWLVLCVLVHCPSCSLCDQKTKNNKCIVQPNTNQDTNRDNTLKIRNQNENRKPKHHFTQCRTEVWPSCSHHSHKAPCAQDQQHSAETVTAPVHALYLHVDLRNLSRQHGRGVCFGDVRRTTGSRVPVSFCATHLHEQKSSKVGFPSGTDSGVA